MRKSLIGLGVAGVATVALVTGCGSGNDTAGMQHSSTTASTPAAGQQADHNEHDVKFAQEMIQHHQQALDMAKMVPGKSTNAKVLDIAKRIEGAQDPEIKKMTEWLTKWGAAPTSTSMPGMDHGATGSSMPGMMTAEEMNKLQQANGAAFDRAWMEMMIKHHQGAIDMAKTHLEKGSNADSKKLAQEIITAQQAEITEMQGLLKSS
ncbi:DUF305 domain-containing protein [Lentzea sp. BCCO 10_0061]|uniref:DUF305 domain-containing protein n=1 Tax=Lentzea sokolovensis TaxID=3095429 RepID=A0ABU4UX12_9PSEU|nr:DUF305 domain-containing protein [Lentzea sp. BCCO 10_0061]MDX8143225.1 DUF305 domain-containing protein [Lentzea sp. BCCO 10_0061]